MRRVLPIVALVAGLALTGVAYAQSNNANSGNVGTNVGDSMKQPMVVNADNGVVRAEPNATAQIRTTVPHGMTVTMIGSANGGAWAHVLTADGLDGYIDMVQLAKP